MGKVIDIKTRKVIKPTWKETWDNIKAKYN